MSFRIYVTGSRGIIGRHVVEHLGDLAPEADVICNSVDLTNIDALHQEITQIGQIDLVLHLAAKVPVDEVRSNPAQAYAVNVGGTINLLSALSGNPAHFLLCSSAHVYAPGSKPLREDAPTAPSTLYGQTKLMAEEIARAICTDTGRDLCVARVFSIHDPAQTGSFLRPSLERRFRDMKPGAAFELHGADSRRDFLTARAAAGYLVDLALSQATGVVNVASGRPMPVRDFAQYLAPYPLNIVAKGDPQHLIADVTRLHDILGDSHDPDCFDHHSDLQPRQYAAAGG